MLLWFAHCLFRNCHETVVDMVDGDEEDLYDGEDVATDEVRGGIG